MGHTFVLTLQYLGIGESVKKFLCGELAITVHEDIAGSRQTETSGIDIDLNQLGIGRKVVETVLRKCTCWLVFEFISQLSLYSSVDFFDDFSCGRVSAILLT